MPPASRPAMWSLSPISERGNHFVELATADAEYAATYGKARAAGWSVDELSKLGLPDPQAAADSPRRRRSRSADTTSPAGEIT